LIITADDFGANSGINEAVRLAAKDGILTSASIMATSPRASLEEALLIAEEVHELDVGIHITLISDRIFRHQPISTAMEAQGLTQNSFFSCKANSKVGYLLSNKSQS